MQHWRISTLMASKTVLISLVGATGFELATPASRRQCSTRLSYAPKCLRTVLGRGLDYRGSSRFWAD